MFMRRKRTESCGETRSSELGNFSGDMRGRSSAEFPGTAHKARKSPCCVLVLNLNKTPVCENASPPDVYRSDLQMSLIPLGPDLLLTLFRGTLK